MSRSKNYRQEDLGIQAIASGIFICILLCLGWGMKNYYEQLMVWKQNEIASSVS